MILTTCALLNPGGSNAAGCRCGSAAFRNSDDQSSRGQLTGIILNPCVLRVFFLRNPELVLRV